MAKKINILFTCVGRRVSLLKSFRKAAKRLKIDLRISGADASQLSAALQLCEQRHIVSLVGRNGYLGELLKIVKQDKIALLIPTVDLDLRLLAASKSKFEQLGCRVLVSEPKVIEICQDKRKAFEFLRSRGFGTPETISARSALLRKRLSYPRFLKPWDGHASRGTATVSNREELKIFAKRIPNCIVQEYVDGVEYTCDAYVDFDMKVRTVVPRKRIEVRAGEVSKGQTVHNEQIISSCAALVEALGAGPGVITIQLIVASDGDMSFIEVNPRFGGGAPLSIKAGANFPRWILQELIGIKPRIRFGAFKDDLTMLRYDDEVWVDTSQ